MDSGRKTEDGDLWANSPIIRDINTAIRGLRLGLKSIDGWLVFVIKFFKFQLFVLRSD